MSRSSPEGASALAQHAPTPSANPFPGPRPFAESEEWLFFGRERELSDLVALLFAQRAILLHGPSGGGKSSLVHAGLIPRARARGFEFLPVARVRDITSQTDDEVAGNRYLGNVIDNWRAVGLEVPAGARTLAHALGDLPPAQDPGRVVVFDQFEELVVLHPERWKDRADLLLQVQAALDHDPLLHVMFVLRDDYLARLQPLTPLLRDRLSTRYHLRGLTSVQALDAVVKPFATTGKVFTAGVAESFVKALRAHPGVAPDTRTYEAEDVEPVQLQIVCRTFFERLPSGVVEIDADHIERHADVGQALVSFYEQAITAAIRGHSRVAERKVRLWFERELITPARTRGIVYRDERATAGLTNEVVDELERRRVVRSEPRGSATWYELPHDRLVDAVLASNRIWYATRSRTVTRISAVVASVGILAAALSFLLLVRGGGSSEESSEPKPEIGRIAAPGQRVEFRLSGRTGQLLTAVMTPEEGFLGDLRLLDDQGTVLRQSPPGSSTPVLTSELPADGDYRVEARGRGSSTGSFLFSSAVQSVDARTELTPRGPVPGAISAPDEVDVYTFAGRAGSVAQITMTSDELSYEDLVLLSPQGQGFARPAPDAYGFLAAVLPQDGVYELRASSADGAGGSYRLDLEFPDDVGRPGTTTGTFDARNIVDVRSVRSAVGGALEVTYAPPTAGRASLLAADGRLLADVYVQEGASEDGFAWVLAPATPYLLVTAADSSPTPYDLSLVIEDSLPLVGGSAEGELSRPGQLAAYHLDGQQGDIMTVLVTPVGDLDPVVQVVQPDGSTLIQQSDGGSGQDELFTVQLRSSGPHLVVIGTEDPTQTGGFGLAITQSKAAIPS